MIYVKYSTVIATLFMFTYQTVNVLLWW